MALIGHQKRRLVRDTIASIEKYWGWYLFIFLAAAVLITYWEMQQVPSIACSTGCAVNSLTDAEQQRQYSRDLFEEYTRVLEIALLLSGFVTIFVLVRQGRSDSLLRKKQNYHEYFADLPESRITEALRSELRRLSIVEPKYFSPIVSEDAKKLLSKYEINGEHDCHGMIALSDYLNQFEEFAAAVNGGVVDDYYARDIEGFRVMTAYFAFLPCIKAMREEKQKSMRELETKGNIPIRTHTFNELELLAKRWREEREEEWKKFKKDESALHDARPRAGS